MAGGSSVMVLVTSAKPLWPVVLLTRSLQWERQSWQQGGSVGESLMENPIWFNFRKLEGDEGSRKCLACVQAADCISLSLETHFPL